MFLKNVLASIATILALAIGTSAMACTGDTCLDSLVDSNDPVNSSAMVDPADSVNLSVIVESAGGVAGIGVINGIGDDFVGQINQDSSLILNTELDYTGDLCSTDCGSGSLSFTGSAFESIQSTGAAISTTPGSEASLGNASSAASALGVDLNVGN